jgi:hypothetical protein
MKTNPAVDAYIGKAASFARPILEKIRELFHQACPNIEETMKWRFHANAKRFFSASIRFGRPDRRGGRLGK